MTTTTNEAVAAAEAWLDKLCRQWMDFSENLKEGIAQRHWVALGYETFTDMWQARCSHIDVVVELKADVAFQMMDDGATDDEIADAVKGLAPDSVEYLREQKDDGVAPEGVTLRRRRETPP